MTIKIDHSAPPILIPRTKEPDLSKIVDQDILDTFKNTSVFYGDIINAQLIRTMQDLVSEFRGKKSFDFKGPRSPLDPLVGEDNSYQETID